MASLDRLFKARHIATHEADFESIASDDVHAFFRTAEVFIHALNEITSQIIEPNVPRTAFGMSLFAAEEAGKAYGQMRELETKLLSLFSDQEIIMTGTDDASETEPFKAAEEAFEKLVDAEVAFEMARAGMITGNGRRMLEAQTSKEFYEFRIKRLQRVIDDIETQWDIKALEQPSQPLSFGERRVSWFWVDLARSQKFCKLFITVQDTGSDPKESYPSGSACPKQCYSRNA